MSFQDFSLHPTILQNLQNMGFSSPTDIQKQIFPIALEGKDISGLSRTGTGKTAAFLLPTIQRLTTLADDRICLCLAPTRELAQQIQAEAERLSKDLSLGTVSVVGGMSPDEQIASIQGGARIVTGTPGRVIDLFKGRHLDLEKVDILVFDEADRMFDMGFIDDMHFILKKVNRKRQILLFSATMNFSVLNMVYEYGANPEEFNVSRDQMTADKIQQMLFHVGDQEKASALLGVCRKFSKDNGSIIVFVNYKERVPWVAALLSKNGFPAQGLSSLLRQERRNKIIRGFKSGQFRALVATDVASRGLDVDDVSLVVNFHLPEEAATYVHRIGRTARAGRHGIAISLSGSEDAFNQMRIEEFLGSKIPVDWLSDEDTPKEIFMPRREDEQRDEEDSETTDQSPRQEDRGQRERGSRRHQQHPRHTRSERGHKPSSATSSDLGTEQNTVGSNRGTQREPQRGRRDRGNFRKDFREDRRPQHDIPSAKDMPNPLTGAPVIYDMRTGQPKNRSAEEYKSLIKQYDGRLKENEEKFSKSKKKATPAIIKKISSKVTALFGNKRS